MCKVTTKKLDGCGEYSINEDIEYFCKNMNEKDEIKSYKIYNKETSNFCALKPIECEKFGLIKKEKKAPTKKSKALKIADEITVEFLEPLTENDKECMILKGTFLMYHPELNTQNKVLNEKLYPNGRARLFRDNRCYGNWNSENTTYGSSNFTDIIIEFKSKKLANMMGLTWNKNISKGHQNDLSFAMRGIIKIITSVFLYSKTRYQLHGFEYESKLQQKKNYYELYKDKMLDYFLSNNEIEEIKNELPTIITSNIITIYDIIQNLNRLYLRTNIKMTPIQCKLLNKLLLKLTEKILPDGNMYYYF
jgi:hypothetical protein